MPDISHPTQSLTPPRSDSRLTTAVAVASAQVGRGVESRTLMERLQRILAEVDRPRQGQSEAPQRENKSARQNISAMREDLDAVTATRHQGESSRRQLQIPEQHFKEVKQELRTAEESSCSQTLM